MAAGPAHVKVYSSRLSLGVWGGLALVAIALAIMWALPEARVLVGTGLVFGIGLAVVLIALRRHSTQQSPGEHEEASPLHLRD